jgi:hypothetical protein
LYRVPISLSVAVKFNDGISFSWANSSLPRAARVMAGVAMGYGIFTKRISSHLRICSVRALSMKAQFSKKVILKIVLLTVATFVNGLGGKTKSDS